MSRIVSFRGLMADGTQERLSLETIRGEKGYRIIKFDAIAENPGTTAYEHIFKIYKEQQSTVTGDIDFSDNRLLGVGFIKGDELTYRMSNTNQIIFDQEIFNQDIFITMIETAGSLSCNYYIELEVFDLALDESTVATLKDIRNSD
jgi:hypothetical protein